MTLVDRVARRFIARRTPRLEFFSDEMNTVVDSLEKLDRYTSVLVKARDVLRPVAECLRSKSLGKIHAGITSAVDMLPMLRREVEGIATDLQKIDHELMQEVQRQAEIVRAAHDDERVELNDIHLPTAALKALQTRVKRYHRTVEKTFDVDVSFTIDDIGTAGSLDLKAYEKLIEKLPSWEELNVAEIELDGLDEAVASRAFDKAYE